MFNVDEIMDMLDWNNPEEVQEKGRKLAQNVRCINVFLQPMSPQHNKNVWDNCAIVLGEKNDAELRPYLGRLFEWLMDINWPGAYCIEKRLKEYKDKEWFNYILSECINKAKALKEDIWVENLMEFKA